MTKPISDDESDRSYRPTAADRERPAPARTDRHGRDWTKGWVPISSVVGVIAIVAMAVWWYASEHAAIVEAKNQAVAAQAQAAAAQAALAELAKAAQASAAAQASEIAQLRISQAVTETTLVAIRAQLDRIEIQLRKGDR